MKTAIMLASLFLSGCASITKQLDSLPATAAAEVTYTRTGKFSSTTITMQNFVNDGKVTKADEMHLRHSNAWMPNLELRVKGYRREHEEVKP